MLEIIKSLSPKQRALAFVFTTVVSAVVSILTIYLKTDDCGEISDQYTKLVTNQATLMSLNNDLLKQYNQARTDLIAVNGYLKQMDSINKQEHALIQTKIVEHPRIVQNETISIYQDSSGGIFAPNIEIRDSVITPKPKIIRKIIRPSTKLTHIIDSLSNITAKYKEKN